MKSLFEYLNNNLNNNVYSILLEASSNINIYNREDFIKFKDEFKNDPEFNNVIEGEFVIGGKSTWFKSPYKMIKKFAVSQVYYTIIYRFLGKEHYQNTYGASALKSKLNYNEQYNKKTINDFIKQLKDIYSGLLDTQVSKENRDKPIYDYTMNIRHLINTICALYLIDKNGDIQNLNKIKDKIYSDVENTDINKKLLDKFISILAEDVNRTIFIINKSYLACKSSLGKNLATFKDVPFVVRASDKGSHQIYIRSNINYHDKIKSILQDKGVSNTHIDKLFNDLHYGFGMSRGVDFENNLYKKLKEYFLEYSNTIKEDNVNEIPVDPITETERAAKNIINYLINDDEKSSLIKEMCKNISDGKLKVENCIEQAGKKNSKRNSNNKLISNNFEFKNTIYTDNKAFNQNILESGYEISDITIHTNGNNNNKLSNTDIYLSVKYKEAQFSGLSVLGPFYGGKPSFEEFFKNANSHKKQTNESAKEIIDKINDKINIISTDGDYDYTKNNLAFDNFCKLFDISDKKQGEYSELDALINYFRVNRKDRPGDKTQKLQLYKKSIHESSELSDIITKLILQIIGGNYYYVNVDKVIKLPSTYNLDKGFDGLPFKLNFKNAECYLTPSSIRLVFAIDFKDFNEPNKIIKKIIGQLVFRLSEKNKQYPHRLFIKFGNKQNVQLSELTDDNQDLDNNFAEHNAEILNEILNSMKQIK